MIEILEYIMISTLFTMGFEVFTRHMGLKISETTRCSLCFIVAFVWPLAVPILFIVLLIALFFDLKDGGRDDTDTL